MLDAFPARKSAAANSPPLDTVARAAAAAHLSRLLSAPGDLNEIVPAWDSGKTRVAISKGEPEMRRGCMPRTSCKNIASHTSSWSVARGSSAATQR